MANEIIDQETGEITTQPSVPAVRHVGTPSPYSSAETGQIAEAMSAAQGEMELPKRTKTARIAGRDGRQGYEYSYAPFEECMRVVRKALPKHGLMVQQGLVTRADQFFIRTFVRHISGEWIASDYPVLSDRAGAQGFAGATTYAKRYGLSLALGLAAEDDDDGAAAQAAAPEARPDSATSFQRGVQLASETQVQLAREALTRIRREIAGASLSELDTCGIYGPNAFADQKLIEKQKGGAQAWRDLVERDRNRRSQLQAADKIDAEAPTEVEGVTPEDFAPWDVRDPTRPLSTSRSYPGWPVQEPRS